MKTCLSIAGSDCSGGAGIQADIKTFSAHGCFGMSVITSVVAENTSKVISIIDMSEDTIIDQIDAIFTDITVDGVKIGMLSDEKIMKVVANKLKEYNMKKSIVDPVMVAKGGCALMNPDALSTLRNEIVPISYLITPNIPEASVIIDKKILCVNDMKTAAIEIYNMGAKNVLIKGGHLDGDAIDVLYNGKDFFTFTNERINTKNTHGTGCTLSSAITANIANGMTVQDAVKNAKEYVTNAIKYSLTIGKGHGPTNHFYELYKLKGML